MRTPRTHPPARLFAWFAYDGTLCTVCCDCGDVLTGAARLPCASAKPNDNRANGSVAPNRSRHTIVGPHGVGPNQPHRPRRKWTHARTDHTNCSSPCSP